MQILLPLMWISGTLFLGFLSGILGKRFWVFYPISLISGLVVMANIFANKIIQVGPFSAPGGILVFSMIFFITDILSEKWWKKEAKQAVWAGFFTNVVLIFSVLIITRWDSAIFATDISEMFSKVLSLTPRIAIASMLTYLISQHADIIIFHSLKKMTRGKYLWIRNNISTIISQGIDSTLFVVLAFYGIYPLISMIISQWIIKIIIALIDTPFLYITSWVIDKIPRRNNSSI